MTSTGVENLEARFSGRYRKTLLPGVKCHWDDAYRDRKEQGPLPPALLSLIGQSTMWVAESQPHSQRGVWRGWGVVAERKELNTGDTPDI